VVLCRALVLATLLLLLLLLLPLPLPLLLLLLHETRAEVDHRDPPTRLVSLTWSA
jgi:hypothetical protein